MFWLFLIVFIDSIGFGIILPLLPIFAYKYSLTPFELGLLVSIFSLFQFFFSPILGAFSDKIGRKTIIVICLFGIAFSYILLANSNSFLTAFIARAVAGIFTANISISLASASDLSSIKNRGKYISYIGTATGMGFALGPVIGGVLTGSNMEDVALTKVFYIAAIATTTAAIFAQIFLKETISKKNNKLNYTYIKQQLKRVFRTMILRKDKAISLYLSTVMWFVFSGIYVFLSSWGLEVFNLTPLTLGLSGSIFALFVGVTQIISPYILTPKKGIVVGFLLTFIGMMLLVSLPITMQNLLIVLLLLAAGLGLLFSNLNTLITLYASKNHKGFVIGLSQSASTLGQSFGPIIVGAIYGIFSPLIAFISIGIFALLGGITAYKYITS